jgi:hypothetical protein
VPQNAIDEEGFALNRFRPYELILLVAAVLVGAHPNHASAQQSSETGSLILKVTDAEIKLPVIGYLATLTPRNAGSPVLCNSDYYGRAYFKNIAPGLYRLRVTLVGYLPEIIDSVNVQADSVVTISLRLHPYNGLTEYDAYDDLAKGIVRIYRDEWFLGPGANVSSKYGFRNELKCCDPTFRFDRYNNVVYKYLDSLNGPGWYDAYIRDLWLAKVKSDSISKPPKK